MSEGGIIVLLWQTNTDKKKFLCKYKNEEERDHGQLMAIVLSASSARITLPLISRTSARNKNALKIFNNKPLYNQSFSHSVHLHFSRLKNLESKTKSY